VCTVFALYSTVPGMGEGTEENGGRVNSGMTYLICCKNFCNCHNVPPTKKKKRRKKK
jgi:hypothetical protein